MKIELNLVCERWSGSDSNQCRPPPDPLGLFSFRRIVFLVRSQVFLTNWCPRVAGRLDVSAVRRSGSLEKSSGKLRKARRSWEKFGETQRSWGKLREVDKVSIFFSSTRFCEKFTQGTLYVAFDNFRKIISVIYNIYGPRQNFKKFWIFFPYSGLAIWPFHFKAVFAIRYSIKNKISPPHFTR